MVSEARMPTPSPGGRQPFATPPPVPSRPPPLRPAKGTEAPLCQPEPLLRSPRRHHMAHLKSNAATRSTPSSAYRVLFKSKINYFSSVAFG